MRTTEGDNSRSEIVAFEMYPCLHGGLLLFLGCLLVPMAITGL